MISSVHERLSVVDLLAGIIALDVATATETQTGQACRDARRVRGDLDAFEAAAARRSDELKRDGRGLGGESLLTRNGKVTGRDARNSVNRAAALAEAPALESALAGGSISAGHVDAFANATRRAGPAAKAALFDQQAALARLAAAQSPEEFAHSCQRVALLASDDEGVDELTRQRRKTRLRRFIDEATGMFKMWGEFDPELGTRIWRAIEHVIGTNYPPDARPDMTPDGPEATDHLAALALADLIAAAMGDAGEAPPDADAVEEPPPELFPKSDGAPPSTSAGQPSSTRPRSGLRCRPPRGELSVIVDLRTLIGGLHEHSIIEVDPGGITLPIATLRRLACSADILPVVLDGNGVALDVGRSKRLATADQRRALRAMYPGCAVGGCGVHFDRCEVHHLDPFGGHSGTGRTDLERLVPLCSSHHHAAHEGLWLLHLDSTTRMLTVTLPDGTIHSHSPPRARAA